ncbi:unnamed protein product [Soboliphyme baturini]|uniref:GRANULINS domain-containing protein n=1 Tax=Soboliphyme baturini TaxID=241478 RepID=A0A183I9R7_9BILA|nr:unnamed protein product [Soboliphyme baturini]
MNTWTSLLVIAALVPPCSCSPGGSIGTRQKRAFIGYCSNGLEAVAGCFLDNTCGGQFQCDLSTGLCCLRTTSPFLYSTPMTPFTQVYDLLCKDGNPAYSQCDLGGTCPQDYICTQDFKCCKSGTGASCNFNFFPTRPCMNQRCFPGEYCSADGYCCPVEDGNYVFYNYYT